MTWTQRGNLSLSLFWRKGRFVVVKDIPVSISAKDRDLSLVVKGARMFNLLPRCIHHRFKDPEDL